MNCIQPSAPAVETLQVAAVVGLDLVDRGQQLPADAVLGAGRLVDRQQERRDLEPVDEEVRHAGLGRARARRARTTGCPRRAAWRLRRPGRCAASASAWASRPCPSATRCSRRPWPCWPSSSGRVLVDLSGSWSCRPSSLLGSVVARCRCLGRRRGGRRGAVGVAVTVGAVRAARRRRRALGRAEVDDRGDGRGQAGDLHLVDRRARRDVDRDRELLAGDQRHAHVMHLGVRGRHENARVERGCGKRDGEWTA